MRSLLMICVLVAAACTPAKAPPPKAEPEPAASLAPADAKDLIGAWIVTDAGGKPVPELTAESNAGTRSWFHITASDVRGNLGCNDFSATYTASADTFDAEPPLSTQIGCGDAGNAAEQAVSVGLSTATGWTINGDGVLNLTANGQAVLSARRPLPTETAYRLFGMWRITELNGSAVERAEDEAVTIVFERDTASGYSFCNGWGGSYKVSGNELSLSDVAGTAVGCEREDELGRVLGGPSALAFGADGTLTLTLASGESLKAEPF